MATGTTEIASVIAKLAELYPKAFSTSPSHVRPLAIGVKEALFRELETVTPRSLSGALRRYTGSVEYLKATIEGAARVDLEGRPTGTVTAQQAAYAQRRLADLAARRMASIETPQVSTGENLDEAPAQSTVHSFAAAAPQTPAAKPPALRGAPQRLGLADLKRAAAARRRASGYP
jgi:ProP effector